MSTPETKLFDGFPITANRAPRDGEALCAFKCGTIVDHNDKADGNEGHCGMCCQLAVQNRINRVKPIHEAAVAKAEKEGKERAARLAGKSEPEAKPEPEPKPKAKPEAPPALPMK